MKRSNWRDFGPRVPAKPDSSRIKPAVEAHRARKTTTRPLTSACHAGECNQSTAQRLRPVSTYWMRSASLHWFKTSGWRAATVESLLNWFLTWSLRFGYRVAAQLAGPPPDSFLRRVL